MVRRRFGLAVTNVLLLVCTTQSFVILTANVEDIRNIARKFVSDNLANKIADFVVKATSSVATSNVSDENDRNVNTRSASEERSYYNLRNEAIQDAGRNETRSTRKPKAISKNDNIKKYDVKDFLHPKPWEPVDNNLSDESIEKYHKESKPKSNMRQSHRQDKKLLEKDGNIAQKLQAMNIDNQIPKQRKQSGETPYQDSMESLSMRQSKWELDEKRPSHPRKRKLKPAHILKAVSSETEHSDAENDKKTNGETATSIDAFKGFNIESGLTTRKERSEFDQYDNFRNPKSDYVATSGPVALPKVPSIKQWWERDLQAQTTEKQVWF